MSPGLGTSSTSARWLQPSNVTTSVAHHHCLQGRRRHPHAHLGATAVDAHGTRWPALAPRHTVGPVPDNDTAGETGYDDPRLTALYDIENGGRWDIDFYLALAAELGAQSVVDIGCGTGVLAADLATRGHRAIGVDPSPAMLDVARSRPGGDRVQWIHGYAAALPDAVADLVVMSGHVAQYFLTDRDWLEVLGHARRILRPGGHLAFEMRNPAMRGWEQWNRADSFQTLPHPGGGTFDSWVEVVEVDGPTVTHHGHTVLPGGEHVESPETLRFRDLDQLTESLQASGFGSTTAYGDWDHSPITPTSGELILVAARDAATTAD